MKSLVEQVRERTEALLLQAEKEGLSSKGHVSIVFTERAGRIEGTYRVKDFNATAFVERTWPGEVIAGGEIRWHF